MDEALNYIRQAHETIVLSVDTIEQSIRNYPKIKGEIRHLQTKLLAHYSFQNANFYDRIKNMHQESREALKMVEFLTADLTELKIKTLLFFDMHSGELSDQKPKNFPYDFTQFSREITGRLKIEEQYLLPLLNQ